jgi:hypothetical protein
MPFSSKLPCPTQASTNNKYTKAQLVIRAKNNSHPNADGDRPFNTLNSDEQVRVLVDKLLAWIKGVPPQHRSPFFAILGNKLADDLRALLNGRAGALDPATIAMAESALAAWRCEQAR